MSDTLDGEEARSLHDRCAAHEQRQANLWNIIDVLQGALARAEALLEDDPRRFNIFSPHVILAMSARDSHTHPGLSSLRIARTYFNANDEPVGYDLHRAALSRPIHIGAGEGDTVVARWEDA